MGLGRNFINAVVTQVGRDTGRAISNQLYGDAHSTPIRRVAGTSNFVDSQNRDISEQEARIILDREGFKPKGLKSDAAIAIWFLLSLPLLPITLIIYYLNGISKLTRNTTIYTKTVSRANYVQDRRYSDGRRLAGYSPETIAMQMPATDEEKQQYRKRGILQIILGSVQLILLLILINLK